MKEAPYFEFSDEFHDKAVKAAEAGRLPLDGMIELTRLCSLKCTHCYIGDARWQRDPNELTTQQLKDLLDTLARRGTLWLCFTGGEAMIRRDFRELWVYAKQKGFILSLFTNATLIDEAMADFLKQNPPFVTEVSIYGATETTYEAVTLVTGSYKRFLRGIENLRRTGLPWKMKTVVIKENAHELEQMRALAVDWQVSFKFDGNINASIGEGESGGKAPCSSRIESEELIRVELGESVLLAEANRVVASEAGRGRGENLFSCGAGQNNFYVNAAGSLQMCILTGHRGQDLKAAATIDEGFENGWDSFARARQLKRRPDSPCLSCDIASLCENCPGFSHLENGDEHGVVDWLCRNTHLKARALGVPHKCDVRHFVYSPLSEKSHGSQDQTQTL